MENIFLLQLISLSSYTSFLSKITLSFAGNILKRAFCVLLLIVAARMWMMTIPK